MDGWKRKLLGEPEPEPTLLEEIDQCCSLSLKQRVIGFAVCAGLGLLCCFIAMFFITCCIVLSPSKFAVPYTFGNLFAIGATMFLMGPLKQLKSMFHPTRIIASIVFVLAIVLTLVSAFVVGSVILVLLFVVIQFCALIWYCLSYIPYARTCVKNVFAGAVSV